MTYAIADAPPIHGEAVRRASGFVLVAKGRVIRPVTARPIDSHYAFWGAIAVQQSLAL